MILGIVLFCLLALLAGLAVLLCPVRMTRKQPPTKKKVFEVKCDGPVARVLTDKWNWAGTTIPLPFCVLIIYWVDSTRNDPDPLVRIHEFVHVAQDETNAFFLLSWAGYFIETVKEWFITGSLFEAYRANKFERVAYLIEDNVASSRVSTPDWAK